MRACNLSDFSSGALAASWTIDAHPGLCAPSGCGEQNREQRAAPLCVSCPVIGCPVVFPGGETRSPAPTTASDDCKQSAENRRAGTRCVHTPARTDDAVIFRCQRDCVQQAPQALIGVDGCSPLVLRRWSARLDRHAAGKAAVLRLRGRPPLPLPTRPRGPRHFCIGQLLRKAEPFSHKGSARRPRTECNCNSVGSCSG